MVLYNVSVASLVAVVRGTVSPIATPALVDQRTQLPLQQSRGTGASECTQAVVASEPSWVFTTSFGQTLLMCGKLLGSCRLAIFRRTPLSLHPISSWPLLTKVVDGTKDSPAGLRHYHTATPSTESDIRKRRTAPTDAG